MLVEQVDELQPATFNKTDASYQHHVGYRNHKNPHRA